MSEDDNLPAWNGKPGRYEVWFLTMSDGRVGYWIRYTLLGPAGAPPEARLWFARFDRDRPGEVVALNRGLPISAFAAVPDAFEIRMGDAMLRSGRAEGAISGGGHEVTWSLSFDIGEPTYRLLPDALYRGGLAPTKPFSPNPRTHFTGSVTVDGESHQLEAVPGQQGHLYGPRHAERWAWAACPAFDGDEGGTALHALVAQGKRGPFTTPFTTFVGLRWRGEWLRFSKVSRRRDTALGAWRIDVADKRYRLTGRVAGDPGYLVQARYLDPEGSERYCHNTEVGSSRFVLFERRDAGFEEVAVFDSVGTTHAEWAGRTPAPGEFPQHVSVG